MTGLRYTPARRRLTLDVTAAALAGAKVLAADATRRVPVGEGFPGEGELRDSQVVSVDGPTAAVAYTARSAVPAHERLDVAPDGGQRKYLEAAVDANRADVLEAIAAALRPSSTDGKGATVWDPDTWEADFVRAVAETLAAADVARYSPSGAYTVADDLPAVYVATMPAASTTVPVQALSLTPYLIDDTPDEHTTMGLQVRARGGLNPNEALSIGSRVWRVLHRPLGLTLGTTAPVWCPSSVRRSAVAGVPLDPTGRAREAVSNYALLLPRPSAAPWS